MPTGTARVPEDVSGRPRRAPVGSVTWQHTFRALRHRNYRLFFWGQLVSLVGTWMQQTAMSWFVYEITNSKLLLGIVAAMGTCLQREDWRSAAPYYKPLYRMKCAAA